MRSRKLFYAPGIISLTALLFLLPYSYKRAKPDQKRSLILIVPKKATGKEFENLMFTDKLILQLIRHKKKLKFELAGDITTNQKKIELIRYEARKLKYTFDTTTVISVNLSDELNYCDFVKVLDNCISDNIQRFATWDNNFIIFGEYPVPSRDRTQVSYNDIIYLPIKPPKKTLLQKLSEFAEPFTLLQIGSLAMLWLAMILLTIYKIKKRKQMPVK